MAICYGFTGVADTLALSNPWRLPGRPWGGVAVNCVSNDAAGANFMQAGKPAAWRTIKIK